MPKAFYGLKDFSGGLNDAFNPRDIADNQLSETDNIILDERMSIKPLGGDSAHTDIPDGTAGHITPGYGAFVFESDHEQGSSALDTGENWFVMCDGLTGTIDLYDLKGDAFNSSQVDLGTPTSDTFAANKLDFNDNSASGANDTIVDDDDTMISNGFRKGDIIAISGCTDDTDNNLNGVRIKNVTVSTITLDHSGILDSLDDDNEAGTPTITKLIKAVYYFSDEALRIADGTFGASVQPYWYGYVKRQHFGSLSLSSTTSFDNWFSNVNTLAAPTELVIHASNYPSAGAGFQFSTTAASVSGGGYDAVAYQIATSFIYDGHQESLLYVPTANNTFTPSADNYKVTMNLHATAPFDERISGARVYVRVDGTDDPWALLIDIDMARGARAGLSGDYSAWVKNSGDQVYVNSVVSLAPSLETYEILNGFLPSERKITISGNGEGYKTAVVANRRCFVANIKTENEDGQTIQMRDRIMYTPVGKFDTFPRSYFIDVVKGDSEEFIKLEEYSDRLLAFKTRKLYILNIASPSPANWFLEEIKDFSGIEHPHAAVKTEFGICWINKFGLFLYDGNNVTNLLRNKIKESTWQDYVNANTVIGYNPKKYYLVILKSAFATDGDVYVYDFRTGSWVSGQAAFDTNVNRSNIVSDWNGNMTTTYQNLTTGDLTWTNTNSNWGSYSGGNLWNATADNYSVKEWSDDIRDVTAENFKVTTKDIDFGDPGRVKKVYGITLTYKSDNDQTQPIYYATDGGTSFSDQLTGNFSGTGTGWKKLRATSSSPISCQSIRFRITNPTTTTGTSEGIQINDMSIEYRPIYKRVS